METKNMLPNKPVTMLMHQLKEKKSWGLLTLLILVVTVFVLPLLMQIKYREEFIIMGVIEVIIIVLINCLTDFSYLHDSRKYGYYLSKPMSNVQRLNMTLIVNAIFASVFLVPLCILASFSNFNFMEVCPMLVAWLFILMMLTGLSSYLSGNTIIAAIATVFNFALPMFILGVIYFAMDIVSDIAIGFNVSIIMDYFVENIYRIDYLYFIKFADEMNWAFYFTLLIGICSSVYIITRIIIKRRENERIGQHLVFKGYKYLVALLVSTLVPFVFSIELRNNNYFTKLISFVILGSITYYVALVILEKSFKLKKSAYKLLVIFMVMFIGFVLGPGMIVKSYEENVPALEDIRGVLISNSSWVYIEELEETVNIYHLDYEDVIKDYARWYDSKEAIELITAMHKSIVVNQSYEFYDDLNIIYFLKDGSKVSRFFELEPKGSSINEELDRIAKKFEQTDEYKITTMPFIYDPLYPRESREVIFNGRIDNMVQSFELNDIELDGFIAAFKKDVEYAIDNGEHSFNNLAYNNDYFNFRNRNLNAKEVETKDEYLYVEIHEGDKIVQNFDIPNYFSNTRSFLEKYVNSN